MTDKNDFDWATHYFRGFAIICIMACHFVVAFPYVKIHDVFFESSTIFFLFISGYLCQYLATRRPTTAIVYYKKKLQNVIAPYVVFSVVFPIISVITKSGSFQNLGCDLVSIGFLAKGILLGEIQIPYWYIPFVSILFLISPVLNKMSNERMLKFFVIALIVSVVFPKRQFPFVIEWPGTLYLYTYFTPAYLLGFVYCRFKDQLDVTLKRNWIIPLVLSVGLLFWLWDPHFLGVDCVHKDLVVALQRYSMVALALVGFSYIKDRRIAILDAFAKYSFTLFFLHCFVFWRVFFARRALCARLGFEEGTMLVYAIDATLFVFSSLALLGICALLKKATGKYSRYLIGS